jgi:hypothetical protein
LSPSLPHSLPPAPSSMPRWTRHPESNCYDGHGATTLWDLHLLLQGVTSETVCKARCDADRQCEAVVTPRPGQPYFKCFPVRNVDLALCTHSSQFDTHVLTPTPPPPPMSPPGPGPPVPPRPPPYPPGEGRFRPSHEACGLDKPYGEPATPDYAEVEKGTARYRAWWSCHLFQNGPLPSLTDTFADEASLRASIWWRYMDTVYGASTLRYPLSLSSLAYFHAALLPQSVRQSIDLARTSGTAMVPALSSPSTYRYGDFKLAQYPLHHGDIWRSFRTDNFWFWFNVDARPAAIDPHKTTMFARGIPDYARVEISHSCCDVPDKGAPQGLWMYLQPGSGIFFDVGKTVVGHLEDIGCRGRYFEKMGCACRKGYHSWQLPYSFEANTQLFEIINLCDMHVQTDGCFDPVLSAGRYFKGWGGASPCVCKTEGDRFGSPMNCNG